MSTNYIIDLAVAAAALAVLSVAAWAEVSLAAVTRIDIRRLLDERFSREDALALERTQRLRHAMQLIELLAGGTAAGLLVDVMSDEGGASGRWWGLLLALVLLVVLGRVVPRLLAAEETAGERTAALRLAQALAFVFAPIVRPVDLLVALLGPSRRRREEPPRIDVAEAELTGIANGDHERHDVHPFEEAEQEMISGVLHLEEATVREIMVPRLDIVAVSKDTLVSEAVDIALQAGHSRIPVYGRSIDEILGVVYVKDLLRYVNEPHENVTVEHLIRPAYYVPESKHVDDLLQEMQQARVHLAIVVDEFGGTAGIVSIEDILEEIVGEIQDEYDRETPHFDAISEDVAIADGRLSLNDLCDEMHLNWPEAPSGTIAGYLQRQLGRIPAEGESLRVDGVVMTVLKVEHRRIRQVRIERIREDEADAAPDTGETPVTAHP